MILKTNFLHVHIPQSNYMNFFNSNISMQLLNYTTVKDLHSLKMVMKLPKHKLKRVVTFFKIITVTINVGCESKLD